MTKNEFTETGWISCNGQWYSADHTKHIEVARTIPREQKPMVHIGINGYALFDNDCENLRLSTKQVETLLDWSLWMGKDFNEVVSPISHLLPDS